MMQVYKRILLAEMAILSYAFLWQAVFYLTQASPTMLTLPSGSFIYPTYFSRYQPNTQVTWVIRVEERLNINLTLHVRDVEAHRGKCIDIIEIKDGDNSDAPLLGGYCNSNKPTFNIISSSNSLRVWFHSAKNSDGGLGFNVSYTTTPIQSCGGRLQSFPGTFNTPHYPLPYPNNRECTWKILAPHGMYVHVEFQGVYRLEHLCYYTECECVDTLDIKDGKNSLPYASGQGYCYRKPRSFTSRTNKVSMKFVSDYSGRYEGFSARYTTSLTKGCGADLWEDHGVITSPNYPHSYHSYKRCIWRITAPHDHYVTITFHEFDVNAKRACLVDNVAIHDGYTDHSPLLVKLCNGNFVSEVNSTGNALYIVFQSGFNMNAKGFRATYGSYNGKSEIEKRKPRHHDLELSGFLERTTANDGIKMVPRWWQLLIALLTVRL